MVQLLVRVTWHPPGIIRFFRDANLKDVRIAALCSLAFAGFFRYNE